MKTRLAWLSAITFVLVCSAQPIHAQVLSGGAEYDRGLRYRNTTPYDGEPYTQRYSYGTGNILYFNGDARQLWYLDYLDRVDRAQKFGYPMPADPFETSGPASQPAVRVGGFGTGYGIFRRR